ncbi:BlaI/MecI/CopY family transcriptional regulator [Acetatifactor aquisgranensis]|jgi:Predicted transcriptional regulator|uniref:BlaI/MecI/CopY family transcriptional regulator n=1 Tax=Acetatifactor aquisgranensis TaxID=2941233 RepID=UPI0020405A75|nr:BlaI/MecI/CopY family transcriptional regulator [Acetatifactor aquisgranensis]MCI8543669.1 BlaI/MecI/CopY family transcriptional regulator [Lachnospiraceae bacterium]
MNDRISESEWTLMELLWQEEMTQPQLAEKLGKRWNKNTVHTFLTRLCAKGFLQVDKERSPHVYRAIVSRETCEKQERQSFLERVYQGNVKNMVASFVKDRQLSAGEAEELRKLLDEI